MPLLAATAAILLGIATPTRRKKTVDLAHFTYTSQDLFFRSTTPAAGPHGRKGLNARLSKCIPSCLVLMISSAACGTGTAAKIEIYTLAVAGQSDAFIFGAPAEVSEFFGPVGVSLPAVAEPVGGPPGQGKLLFSTSVILSTDSSAIGAGDSIFGRWSATGNANARATYGQIGASGSGSRMGIGDANTVVGFESFGRFADSLTVTSPLVPDGETGFITYQWSVSGSAELVHGESQASSGRVALHYEQTGSPIMNLVTAQLQAGGGQILLAPNQSTAGLMLSDTKLSGIGTFETVPQPFTAGAEFDVRFGLFAAALPRGGSANISFDAKLTGIKISNAAGTALAVFQIRSASGTFYDASGTQRVPEPQSFVCTILICLVLGTDRCFNLVR